MIRLVSQKIFFRNLQHNKFNQSQLIDNSRLLGLSSFNNPSRFSFHTKILHQYNFSLNHLSKFNFSRRKSQNIAIMDNLTKGDEQAIMNDPKENPQQEGKKQKQKDANTKIKNLKENVVGDIEFMKEDYDEEIKIEKPVKKAEKEKEIPVQRKPFKAPPKEESIKSSSRMTTKLLCEIIGSKHYPANEEIELSQDTFVSVYDDNDK